MGKSFAQAYFEAQAQGYGMSKREAEKAVRNYMQEQEDAKAKREQKQEQVQEQAMGKC